MGAPQASAPVRGRVSRDTSPARILANEPRPREGRQPGALSAAASWAGYWAQSARPAPSTSSASWAGCWAHSARR